MAEYDDLKNFRKKNTAQQLFLNKIFEWNEMMKLKCIFVYEL